ncbi:ABC transporter ATP-binding protein [Skermanella aerolata]|uniref:ABC transporter ATP-binding protein n=1 Tax=Skermanella aerolata TaxID=393310 RepID=A0A512E2G0_9PROT|nr:ABC transporter ATP-binding protein [Skermanella aerolata]KJB91400.1 hypothetical protein N826_30615 [Skermanella aerolata KACC 11604]GEO42887.1 ABC transporter ATP-binding protein [Skermanella aerolata]
MSNSLLDVSSLSVAFGSRTPRTVVDQVSFSVAPGETVALVGESGSGKSVTALAIMGLLPTPVARQSSGRILFENRDLGGLSDGERRRLRGGRIGMIFQEPMTSLNPVLSIGRQMTEALEVHRGLSRAAAKRRAAGMLDRVGIADPERRLRQFPHEFSGGMRQRVMIAAVMALEPLLVIADEPTTALDVTIQAQILDLMRAVTHEAGTSLLLITHDMGVVAEMADRVVVMRRGRVVEMKTAQRLFREPEEDYTRHLLAAVPRIDGVTREPSAAGTTQAALSLSGVTKSFDRGSWFRRTPRALAVADVSLRIAAGETLALVGESGSGKSTLGRIAARLIDADSGHIEVCGTDLTALSGAPLRRARRAVQMVFQDPYASLDPRFTVARTLAEPMLIAGTMDRSGIRRDVYRLLDRVGLPATAAERLPHQFSGGQRQRIAIARALAARPAIIIADEPTSALDVSIQAQILELLAEVQCERGLAFLFITHDLAVVRKVAHRVAVMRAGRIVEMGLTGTVLDTPAHPYTAALLSAVPVPDPTVRQRTRLLCPPDVPSGPLRALSPSHWVAS